MGRASISSKNPTGSLLALWQSIGVVALTGVLSVIYSLAARDVSGGFSIGVYMVAAQAAVLTTSFFKWQQALSDCFFFFCVLWSSLVLKLEDSSKAQQSKVPARMMPQMKVAPVARLELEKKALGNQIKEYA